MNWLEFTSSIIGAVAWPAAIIVLVYALRQPIKELVPLLQRMKYKDFEMEFGEKLAEAREVADLRSHPDAVDEISPQEEERILELSRVSPRAAVTEAWRWVEIAGLDAAKSILGEKLQNRTFTYQALRKLENSEKMDPRAISLMRDLRRLRNDAVHSPEFALSSESALEYAQMAKELVGYLKIIGNSGDNAPLSAEVES